MQRGFSLLELSIVLVIIGLITGGIMAGQSMVRAAELRSVMSDINKYKTAINTFKDKYTGLPGDLKNAVRYWGAQAGGTADGFDTTCQATMTAATGTATCNGDGNGYIQVSGGSPVNSEATHAWQQLANAGLIEGQYTGVLNTLGTPWAVGVNVPASKISGVGYALWWTGTYAGSANEFAGYYGHLFSVGSITAQGSAFTPEEAYSIDTKLDDGKPDGGNMLGVYWSTCTTATGNSDTTAAYNLTNKGKVCALYFINFL